LNILPKLKYWNHAVSHLGKTLCTDCDIRLADSTFSNKQLLYEREHQAIDVTINTAVRTVRRNL